MNSFGWQWCNWILHMDIIIRSLGWLNSEYAYFLMYSYLGWLLNTCKYSVFTLQLNTEYNGLCGMQFSIQRILRYSFVSLLSTSKPQLQGFMFEIALINGKLYVLMIFVEIFVDIICFVQKVGHPNRGKMELQSYRH